VAQIHFITDPGDPRLDDYRNIKDRQLSEQGDRFIAESELVVRRLLASRFQVHSLLVTAPRLEALQDALTDHPGMYPVYVVPQPVMDQIAGLPLHRGCLAVGQRPPAGSPLTAIPDSARRVLVLEDLVNVDNIGALARNAAAFGVDALVLSPRCADPFYRKAIRVSAGAVFSIPIVRSQTWFDDLRGLRTRHGLTLVGAVLDPDAIELSTYQPPPRLALLLGAEGPGLTVGAKQLCDARVTIPMTNADSLNVATAAAVMLYQLRP
jgi:tRNA G18 (ribose-2'-O)-methylase SpoU